MSSSFWILSCNACSFVSLLFYQSLRVSSHIKSWRYSACRSSSSTSCRFAPLSPFFSNFMQTDQMVFLQSLDFMCANTQRVSCLIDVFCVWVSLVFHQEVTLFDLSIGAPSFLVRTCCHTFHLIRSPISCFLFAAPQTPAWKFHYPPLFFPSQLTAESFVSQTKPFMSSSSLSLLRKKPQNEN